MATEDEEEGTSLANCCLLFVNFDLIQLFVVIVCVCLLYAYLFVLFSFLSVKENDLKKDFDLYQVIFFNEYYCSLFPKHQGNHINSEICTKSVLKFDVVVILL